MVIGMKTLTYSASFYEDEEDAGKPKDEKSEALMMGGTVALSIVFAIGIFMLLPYFCGEPVPAADGFRAGDLGAGGCAAAGDLLRLYRADLPDGGYPAGIPVPRAEHKCINCIEHGMELNVEKCTEEFPAAPPVRDELPAHRHGGEHHFLSVYRVNSPLLRVVVRILLVPVIAGVSYEFIRLAGKSENRWC